MGRKYETCFSKIHCKIFSTYTLKRRRSSVAECKIFRHLHYSITSSRRVRRLINLSCDRTYIARKDAFSGNVCIPQRVSFDAIRRRLFSVDIFESATSWGITDSSRRLPLHYKLGIYLFILFSCMSFARYILFRNLRNEIKNFAK